jgi:solute carrier family 25 (mitochondrial S-adenosylmethionine transporter), member 26
MLWRHEAGPARRLWSGYTALAARNLPFTAMQFPMFEFFRGRLWTWRDRVRQEREGKARLGPAATSGEDLQVRIQSRDGSGGRAEATGMLWETGLVTGASAAVSGALAAVVTTPTDVVKTRMMLEAGEKDRQSGHRRKQGGFEIAKHVFNERGIRGLFRGGLLRAAWTAVGSGLYLGTYEVAKLWLKGGKGDPREIDL